VRLSKHLVFPAFFLVSLTAFGASQTPRRAQTLTAGELQSFLEGDADEDLVLEFRAGDVLNVSMKFEGDLLESTPQASMPVRIKKGFFLRMQSDDILMSWDGTAFKPWHDMVGGKFSASAHGEQTATSVSFLLALQVKD